MDKEAFIAYLDECIEKLQQLADKPGHKVASKHHINACTNIRNAIKFDYWRKT
jgi:hypothetical protein